MYARVKYYIYIYKRRWSNWKVKQQYSYVAKSNNNMKTSHLIVIRVKGLLGVITLRLIFEGEIMTELDSLFLFLLNL